MASSRSTVSRDDGPVTVTNAIGCPSTSVAAAEIPFTPIS